jgi:hypothetical protein
MQPSHANTTQDTKVCRNKNNKKLFSSSFLWDWLIGQSHSVFFTGPEEERTKKEMEWHFCRNIPERLSGISLSYFFCLRLDGGVRGRNHWENFVVFGFPKAQSYKEKTSHHLALDHKKKHTTAYKNGGKKEKVCAVWALAFVHREEKERRSNMPWPSQLFWEPWFLLGSRLALPFVDVGRKEIITSKIDALRPKSRALFGFFSGFSWQANE